MCTVTFWPNPQGYRLGMNRDERHTRPQGLPPRIQTVGQFQAVFPTEPSGGSWVGLNDQGTGFALVNWYAQPLRDLPHAASRGIIVPALLATQSIAEAELALRALPLDRLQPFRLMGCFPPQRELRLWQWNGLGLTGEFLPWQPAQWRSSGWDEPTADRIRGAVFQEWSRRPDAGSPGWLLDLHASHVPEAGAFSHCVHRTDAGTVSYTELDWNRDTGGRMRYLAGCPCSAMPDPTASASFTEWHLPPAPGSFAASEPSAAKRSG
jgi:hypothetical protein